MQLYTRLYFRDHPQPRLEARVIAVSENSLDVLVPRYGIEGKLHLFAKGVDARVTLLAHGDTPHALEWQTPGSDQTTRVRVFDVVHVSISVLKSQHDDIGAIRIDLIEPAPPTAHAQKPPKSSETPEPRANTAKNKTKNNADDKSASKKRRHN